MSLDSSTGGEVEIALHNCIKKLINKLPEDMVGKKVIAAEPECLFDADGSAACLLKEDWEELV